MSHNSRATVQREDNVASDRTGNMRLLDRHVFLPLCSISKFHQLINEALWEQRRIWLPVCCLFHVVDPKLQECSIDCNRVGQLSDDFEEAIREVGRLLGVCHKKPLARSVCNGDCFFLLIDKAEHWNDEAKNEISRLMTSMHEIGAILVLCSACELAERERDVRNLFVGKDIEFGV